MYGHPDVAEVGVSGVPDPDRSEDVMAFVVPRPAAEGRLTGAGLVAWCRAQKAVDEAPRRIRFVSALPTTGSGQILERRLRDMAAGGG
jgi:fatty-acyl-CoA synthase